MVYYLDSSEKLGNLFFVAFAVVILENYKTAETRKMEKETKEKFGIKAKESTKESSVEPEYEKPKNNQITLSNLIEQARKIIGEKSRRLEEMEEEEKIQYLKSNILLLPKLVDSPMWHIIIASNTAGNTKDDIIKNYDEDSDTRLLISTFIGELAKNKLI